MQKITFLSADGKTTVHAAVWLPEGKPRGIVQIIHGMAEYGERYVKFAEFLASNGFIAGADDHLGHGGSVVGRDDLGYFSEGDGVDAVLCDLRAFSLKLRALDDDAPFFLLGHSMGSFFCRRYISVYGSEYDGAVIMGSGYQGALTTGAAIALTKLVAAFKGERYRSVFIDNLAFGSYNRRFSPARTKFDWLSKNTANVDSYIADELCGVPFTCNGFLTLFKIVRIACSRSSFEGAPVGLPLLIISGADDPVGGYGKGVEKVARLYKKYGSEEVRLALLSGGRHEILNDDCAEEAREIILTFLTDHTR